MAAILGCSDSRVPAEIVFDQGPGDLFVVRVAGNIAAPTQIGSIEFAASVLDTSLIVVLGHEECGAVRASIEQLRNPVRGISPHLERVTELIFPAFGGITEPAAQEDDAVLLERATRANVVTQTERLRQESSILRRLEQADELLIVGAMYSVRTGGVEFLDGA